MRNSGFITDAVDGWASIGLAFGRGTLTLKDERQFCTIDSCFEQQVEENDEASFGVMPTLAFGASAKLSSKWGLGPVFRMYVLSVGEACTDIEGSATSPGFPPSTVDENECTSDTDEVAVRT